MDQNKYFGEDYLSKISTKLNEDSIKRVFLVTGKKSYTNSLAKQLIEKYFVDFEITRFYDFSENPKVEDVKRAIQEFNHSNSQIILAIGGGSVIDMGKLIKAYSNLAENIEFYVSENRIGSIASKMIAIPTTSGSGSEATHFAVLYIDGKKYSIANRLLKPNDICLIPELTYSTTSYLTAVTGIDALSQSIESWWSCSSTEESINFSKKAIEIIWDNLLDAIGGSKSAKDKMILASHFAGKAINITKTTGPHALSYGLTTYFGLPHGHSVGVFLPVFAKLNKKVSSGNCNDKRGVGWVIQVMEDISGFLGALNLEKTLYDFLVKCGIEIDILCLDKELFIKNIENYNEERMGNNPVRVSKSDILLHFYH